jgi:hypothetical protein
MKRFTSVGKGRVKRVVIGLVACGLLLMAAFSLATSTTMTRQGVNAVPTDKPIPLYVKVIDFVHRHEHYRLLAREITDSLTSDRARADAVLAWTHKTILLPPEGYPTVDDHVWDTIVRRYGAGDQQGDVLTVLLTYSGIPAYRARDSTGPMWGYAYARIDGDWMVVWIGGPGGFVRAPSTPAVVPPRPSFAELQMPGPRIAYEIRQRIGW